MSSSLLLLLFKRNYSSHVFLSPPYHHHPRDDFNIKVLQAFVELHEFADLNLVQALRYLTTHIKKKKLKQVTASGYYSPDCKVCEEQARFQV